MFIYCKNFKISIVFVIVLDKDFVNIKILYICYNYNNYCFVFLT